MSFAPCVGKTVHRILADLDCPRSLTVKILIDHEDWDQLTRLKTDPALYDSADRYFRAAAATELLRKNADLEIILERRERPEMDLSDPQILEEFESMSPEERDAIPSSWFESKVTYERLDKAAVALAGFWQSEKDCCRTNARLKPFLTNGPFADPQDILIGDFLLEVKRWISRTLGELPDSLEGRFGPGATFKDVGTSTTVPHKMSSRPTVTQSARCLLNQVEHTAWFRALLDELPNRSDPENIRGNRFTTVPKDATKDRGIAIEPSINVFLQLAVGGAIRERLRRVGIDLEEGQAVHRRVACEASKTGRHATIDLSSASDTVCKVLVELLLPPDWYALLACLRSTHTGLKRPKNKSGKEDVDEAYEWIYLEKFSSMGNGFTFELETLIFLSLAVATAKKLGVDAEPGVDIYVYGDDIIVPVEIAKPLLAVLRWCGFTPNERKTFITGPFRESCGGDYFNGVDVRPFYMKEFPYDPATWIVVANGIRRMASADNSTGFDRLPLRRSWFCALDNIPDHVRRLRGPVQLGDTVIHDSPENWRTRWHQGWQTRIFTIWSPVTPRIPLRRWSGHVQLASILYGIPPSGPGVRGSISGYRRRNVALNIVDEQFVPGSSGSGKRMFKRLRNLLGIDG